MHDKPDDHFIITPKAGDKIRVRIDFNDQDIKLYYNDQFINSVFKHEISNAVVPAVSVLCVDITVTGINYE